VDLDLGYAITLLAAVLLGAGFVLQQYAAEQEPDSRFLSPRILTDLLRKPRWLLGIACMVAGMLLAARTLGHLQLTLVEPLLTTYLVWALVLAVPLSRQPVRLTEVAGALILCGGVALLSLSRSTTPIGLSVGSLSHWYTAAIIAGVAFIAVQAGRRRQGQARATLTGLGAGLVLGIQDAFTRQALEGLQGNPVTVLFTTWPAYALLGAGIIGLWLVQSAFSAGPLHYSLPTIAAGEPAAGIVLGIVVFGDRIQVSPGMLAIQAGGIAALIAGAVVVARSPAFAGLQKITGHITPGPDSANPTKPEGPPGLRSPESPPDQRTPQGPPSLRSPEGSADGKFPSGATPRKFSRPAHRRRFTTPSPPAKTTEPGTPAGASDG
jgi:drug/metabolite transporter (DMT)-like permease